MSQDTKTEKTASETEPKEMNQDTKTEKTASETEPKLTKLFDPDSCPYCIAKRERWQLRAEILQKLGIDNTYEDNLAYNAKCHFHRLFTILPRQVAKASRISITPEKSNEGQIVITLSWQSNNYSYKIVYHIEKIEQGKLDGYIEVYARGHWRLPIDLKIRYDFTAIFRELLALMNKDELEKLLQLL